MIADIDLDHVAVATERRDDAWPRYAGDLAGRWLAEGGTTGFWSAQVQYANGMKVEVLEPFEVERNDFLRRFLDRNGPGPHHMTFKVADILSAIDAAERAGYRPVNVNLDDPDWKEAFLHPKDAPGVVVQLAESHGDWQSPPPATLPAPRTDEPATLVHVCHAVRALDDGLRLFAGLLAGQEVARGEDDDARWVDLRWPGPGRVRIAEPAGTNGALAKWIGDRTGRVHHIAFATPLVSELGTEVAPEANLGTRLRLAADPSAFVERFAG